jgi:hypothetical protein
LPRQKPASHFRVTFERLESRDLMAADLAHNYGSTAFLGSVLAHHDASVLDAVGAVLAKVVASSAASSKPVATPVSAAAKPSTPAPDWFAANLHDAALQSLARQEASDNVLSRQDMLNIFGQVEKDGTVTANELGDLKQIVARSSWFTTDNYVDVLAMDVVAGNPANAHYQSSPLGNLAAGSKASQLEKLVDKWFLGQDHPATMSGVTYVQATGSLFPHAPVYTDVRQGLLGDCYYLASLAETALVSPSLIGSMFIANGDGTYTVRFNNNGKSDYVTVDSKLPVDRWGNYVYDNYGLNVNNKSAPLWVALAEKAYVQMNESRWLRTDPADIGQNSYNAISGGYMFEALNQITGKTGAYSWVGKNTFTAAYAAGKLITFGSYDQPGDPSVVGDHAYAVVSYNKTTQQVTLFNPWGINNGYAPGLVTLSWAQMQQDFAAMEYTA